MTKNDSPSHEPAEIHHPDHGHHEKHEVPVTIDGRHQHIKPGEYLVSKLKEQLGVDPAKELDQVHCGEFIPLDDNAHICIKGHEVFVSHVRTGGSS